MCIWLDLYVIRVDRLTGTLFEPWQTAVNIGSTARRFKYRKNRKRERNDWGLFGATLLIPGRAFSPSVRPCFASIQQRIGLEFNHRSIQKPF
jgi:hypothetical protein